MRNQATTPDRSNFLRQDGGLCFEIPPWQHQPVELEKHILRVQTMWGASNYTSRREIATHFANGELSRYMDTVIGPFLDTYHRNIQNSYQQFTTKILRRIKEEVNQAVKRKQQIYKELIQLADDLQIPELCAEERRATRTTASNFVSQIFACTEDARAAIAKMGKYAEEMISITRTHMQTTMNTIARYIGLCKIYFCSFRMEVEKCLESMSIDAVTLGYELDLSLTNARRHNEQSCERLSNCALKARKRSDESVAELRDLLYQCVYT
ncbi:uncharacterized protein LOC126375100 [Pectinophora gossypiella]|uniref:uncharacterized protein LOC126375100 n=1 Tax=Pectinophora gossypiella TaxID=13191 RepID=UPI00214E9B65|nr:uncharacterized protein LOC126375100 [Pectinophora gossypiella]